MINEDIKQIVGADIRSELIDTAIPDPILILGGNNERGLLMLRYGI